MVASTSSSTVALRPTDESVQSPGALEMLGAPSPGA